MNPLESFVSAMTLSELAAKTGTSVADMVAFATAGAPATKATQAPRAKPAPANAKQTKPTGAKPKAASKRVNTRNLEGREAYDAAVLAWLKENTSKTNPQPASKVLKACGGTGLQGRTALTRLIEAGKASFVGRARATKYWAK